MIERTNVEVRLVFTRVTVDGPVEPNRDKGVGHASALRSILLLAELTVGRRQR